VSQNSRLGVNGLILNLLWILDILRVKQVVQLSVYTIYYTRGVTRVRRNAGTLKF